MSEQKADSSRSGVFADAGRRTLQPGDTLGSYRLEGYLGRGGTASVFAVTRLSPSADGSEDMADLVLKLGTPWPNGEAFRSGPVPDASMNHTMVLFQETGGYGCKAASIDVVAEALWAEFSFLLRTDSEVLPKVHEFASTHDVTWFIMQRLHGRTLREQLAGATRSSKQRWVHSLGGLLEILAQAHSLHYDFYHGDIKPENIIVDSETDRLRLIDPARLDNGAWLLTPSYNPLGRARMHADTAGIATIAVEILTGQQPFKHVVHPLMESCCSGLTGRMPQHTRDEAISQHLSLDTLRKMLPSGIRELVVGWVVEPRSYEELLTDWGKLVAAAA